MRYPACRPIAARGIGIGRSYQKTNIFPRVHRVRELPVGRAIARARAVVDFRRRRSGHSVVRRVRNTRSR